ncbi:MAG: 16S rRNA (cytidine(1402)-2'-O)-methyltransferase [Candidatus Latescibacteria bacterium]|nr:16S rRNA (cytidine(1402)-2'-O)-methyltransferase [Candidatus Latescibacterota bacterium]NIM66455.1 16S rRNA (cytidine(1402)-2'-O)-methyltransferase [Candidatus Latescibacterota bacterium]NIO02935.1 16S rRNA (cytidine(1402)-2'-O)-methyltransferase [Candidatus Latescibacterota bacterium]NIO30070.1 16S rRNA (cytidine(1402)-2'-O)-methyltransferase [Candidatus Latescibacterota bacterium]NIO57685.1 16S rRNA (cytidine(1402)-2'-O)-methyltransferase [Candidatus Latescibacterota bacterium]
MTFRGLETLKQAQAILAEDTRHTRKLLGHFGIQKRLVSYHDFNKERVTPSLIRRLKKGENLALVTDAGTPGISDPGFYIVRAALAEHIPVRIIPGANAILPALVLSGFPTDSFCFEGFFPKKRGEVEGVLQALGKESRTAIFFVSPHRLLKVLEAFSKSLPSRKLAIARELTKLHEEICRGTASELLEIFSGRRVRGEIVLVVKGKPRKDSP